MKRTIGLLAMLAMVGVAHATTTTNYVPDGQFESPAGDVGPWQNMFGGDYISFPSTGGNPDGCLQISDGGSYGGVAYVNPPDVTIASLGLTAGQTYTFVMDMQIVAGSSIGGLKLESWTDTAIISDSGNMYPLSTNADWTTYSFNYTIAPGATHLNVVPLWGPNSTVNFDNIGVVIVGLTPVSVSITSPTNSQVVSSNFTINASASVSPGTVTNVGFYIDNILVGSATNSPFGYIATGVAAGAHTLTAIATDSNGNHASSSVVNVTVTNAAAAPFGAYEPFNYTALTGGTPTTGTGFSGNWSCGAAGTMVAGLTYPSLATANNALQSSSQYQLETLSSVPSGAGSIWVSLLFQQSGDNGGNRDGFVLEDATGKGVMFAYQQYQAAVGEPALTTVSSYTAVGHQLSPYSGKTQTYNSPNLYVFKLTYNGGALSRVDVYSNPTAGQGTAPSPDFSVTSGLSGIGVLSVLGVVHQAGIPITVDEIRCGQTFADVVGANLKPTVPTTLDLNIQSGAEVSWAAQATNYYQPQSSTDGVYWNNLGNLLYGTNVTSIYDPAPSPYYQVQEIMGVAQEEILNGDFEIGDGFGGAGYWAGGGSQPPTQMTADAYTGTASESVYVTNSGTAAQTSDLQQNLLNMGGPGITGGNTYNFSFWAKSLGRNPAGGYVQRYKVTWLDQTSAIAGAVGFNDFTAKTNGWTQINVGPLAAPTNAVNVLVEFYCATGGITNDYGGVLIDDVSLAGSAPTGSINILTPIVRNAAVFSATIEANGTTATDASGMVTFKTNSVFQSSALLTNGVANSASTITPVSYTITAIYSGDATYIGSTNTIVVGTGINPTPTQLIASVSNNQLTLSWPTDHTGWSLQAQTNSLNAGLTANWYTVPGSTSTNQMTFTINPAVPSVFYRLKLQ